MEINSLSTIWNKILLFNDKYFKGWKMVNEIFYSNALSGECGELCNITKHMNGGGTKKTNKYSSDDILSELVDIYIYTVLFVTKYDITQYEFSSLVNDKINENIRRMEDNKR